MQVRVRISHRADQPREDGSPGFRDYRAGDVVEIDPAAFDPTLHARCEDPPAAAAVDSESDMAGSLGPDL